MPRNSVAPAVGCHFASSDSSRPETPAPTFQGVVAAVELRLAAAACNSGQRARSGDAPFLAERGGELFHLDGCTRVGELLLNGRGFVFRDAFLHGLGSAID